MAERDAELKYFMDKKRVEELEPISEEPELDYLVKPSGLSRLRPLDQEGGESHNADAETDPEGEVHEDEDAADDDTDDGEGEGEEEEQPTFRCPELAYFADKHQDKEYDALLDAAYEMLEEDCLVFNLDLDRELDELEAWIEKSKNEEKFGWMIS